MKIIFLTIYLFVLVALFPPKTYAYLDPGSGSYILQMAIGLFIGLSFFFRTSLKRIMIFVKNILFKKDEDAQKD